jgi:hypothetical protein
MRGVKEGAMRTIYTRAERPAKRVPIAETVSISPAPPKRPAKRGPTAITVHRVVAALRTFPCLEDLPVARDAQTGKTLYTTAPLPKLADVLRAVRIEPTPAARASVARILTRLIDREMVAYFAPFLETGGRYALIRSALAGRAPGAGDPDRAHGDLP